jgi:hypothetical protein
MVVSCQGKFDGASQGISIGPECGQNPKIVFYGLEANSLVALATVH